MSHNCVANTKITTREDFSYVCQATVVIPAGEEIVTNYHHYHYQFYGTPYRRADLKSTWSFECICPRCKDPTEYGSYVSAMLCERCTSGYILPITPLDFKVIFDRESSSWFKFYTVLQVPIGNVQALLLSN